MTKPVAIASDQGGYELKQSVLQHFKDKGIPFEDFGSHSTESVDYPDYGIPACKAVQDGHSDFAILICGTGIGMSMTANKMHGIRACACSESFSAEMTRLHNNANVLCLGGRVIGPGVAIQLVDIFLNTQFEGGRHQNRIDKFMALEDEY